MQFKIWKVNISAPTTLLPLYSRCQQVRLSKADVINSRAETLHLQHLAPLVCLEFCINAQKICVSV